MQPAHELNAGQDIRCVVKCAGEAGGLPRPTVRNARCRACGQGARPIRATGGSGNAPSEKMKGKEKEIREAEEAREEKKEACARREGGEAWGQEVAASIVPPLVQVER